MYEDEINKTKELVNRCKEELANMNNENLVNFK
jgi:hypothetical protein